MWDVPWAGRPLSRDSWGSCAARTGTRSREPAAAGRLGTSDRPQKMSVSVPGTSGLQCCKRTKGEIFTTFSSFLISPTSSDAFMIIVPFCQDEVPIFHNRNFPHAADFPKLLAELLPWKKNSASQKIATYTCGNITDPLFFSSTFFYPHSEWIEMWPPAVLLLLSNLG